MLGNPQHNQVKDREGWQKLSQSLVINHNKERRTAYLRRRDAMENDVTVARWRMKLCKERDGGMLCRSTRVWGGSAAAEGEVTAQSVSVGERRRTAELSEGLGK